MSIASRGGPDGAHADLRLRREADRSLDQELLRMARQHRKEDHEDRVMSDGQVRDLIAAEVKDTWNRPIRCSATQLPRRRLDQRGGGMFARSSARSSAQP